MGEVTGTYGSVRPAGVDLALQRLGVLHHRPSENAPQILGQHQVELARLQCLLGFQELLAVEPLAASMARNHEYADVGMLNLTQ